MKQAIAGVAPRETAEVTVMTVWPSIAAFPSGRFLGSLYNLNIGVSVFTLGNILVLASIPHALALYFYRLLPSIFGVPLYGTCYRLTNRRVVELRNEINLRNGIPHFSFGIPTKSLQLDRFDSVEIDVRPGQQWFQAGDLIFYHGDTETFRLDGVSRPEAFRQTCIKSNMSFVGVQEALEREAALA